MFDNYWIGIFFWGFLIFNGLLMIMITPRAVTIGSFFRGEDEKGRSANTFLLTSSIFISWIFAKSVTNAANLGAEYGIVGGIAYAIYWLCIPLAGFVIYRLRRKFAAKGLIDFLTSNYGQGAAFAFSAAILIRLFNEVWSNTSVIGGYYGEAGSKTFIIAATIITATTLYYAVKGGLRSSLITDAIQSIVFIFFVIWVIGLIIPHDSVGKLFLTGSWHLNTGVDLLLVTLLQIFSYPFHDPTLTDLGFVSEEKTMLKSFIISGLLGFIFILIFSLVGVHSSVSGLPVTGNVPAQLGKAMGTGAYFIMLIIMISSAGSTLDSTFSSLSKLTAQDLPNIWGYNFGEKARKIGMIMMVIFAILGNLPMIIGTSILKATTISGTMVMGLAPIFILHGFVKPTKLGFHLSFWCGIILGIVYTLGWFPESLGIGNGKNALLLGVNFYGLILCTVGYIAPALFSRRIKLQGELQDEHTWTKLSS